MTPREKSYSRAELARGIGTWLNNEDRTAIAEGLACLGCAEPGGPMVPLGHGPEGQVFAHVECLGEVAEFVKCPEIVRDTGHYGSHDVTPDERASWEAEEPER